MVHRQLSHNGFPMDVRVGARLHNPVDLKKGLDERWNLFWVIITYKMKVGSVYVHQLRDGSSTPTSRSWVVPSFTPPSRKKRLLHKVMSQTIWKMMPTSCDLCFCRMWDSGEMKDPSIGDPTKEICRRRVWYKVQKQSM